VTNISPWREYFDSCWKGFSTGLRESPRLFFGPVIWLYQWLGRRSKTTAPDEQDPGTR
jgi:hypothetical protein